MKPLTFRARIGKLTNGGFAKLECTFAGRIRLNAFTLQTTCEQIAKISERATFDDVVEQVVDLLRTLLRQTGDHTPVWNLRPACGPFTNGGVCRIIFRFERKDNLVVGVVLAAETLDGVVEAFVHSAAGQDDRHAGLIEESPGGVL